MVFLLFRFETVVMFCSFLFICSWWTCSSVTATSGDTFYCSTSSSSSTWRVRSSLKGEPSLLWLVPRINSHWLLGGFIFSFLFCPPTAPVVFWMMIRPRGLRRQLKWFIRSVLSQHWYTKDYCSCFFKRFDDWICLDYYRLAECS